MKGYNTEEFRDAFTECGIKKGDLLNIHSSLFNFGIPSDCTVDALPQRILEILLEVNGPEGTIAVPVFNFDFCKGVPFNRQTTPSKLMGIFSEHVLQLKESVRSSHPMQSVSVIGKYAEEITRHDTLSSFSDNGAWSTMEKLNAKIVLLGSDFKSPSFFHLVEEREQVPYRYWKSFSGKYFDNGVESVRSYKMYVRQLDPAPILNLSSIEEILAEKNLIKYAQVGVGKIICFQSSDFISIAKHKIQRNPWYFVSNHRDYLKEL